MFTHTGENNKSSSLQSTESSVQLSLYKWIQVATQQNVFGLDNFPLFF